MDGQQPPPPVPAVDRFPHERPGALALADVPAASSRRALAGLANGLIAIYVDTINELRETAERCRTEGDLFNEIGARKAVGMLALKAIEQSHGRKVTMDLNVCSQEDLVAWGEFSAEERAVLERLLDRQYGIIPVEAVDVQRLSLPATGARLEP